MSGVSALNKITDCFINRPSSSAYDVSSDNVYHQTNQSTISVASSLVSASSERSPLLRRDSVIANQVSLHSLGGRGGLLHAVKDNNFQMLEKYLVLEVWEIIAKFLDIENIKKLMRVSKVMNVIINQCINYIEVVNTVELLGAIKFITQANLNAVTLRLAKGGYARNVSIIKNYPSLSEKNLKIALAKLEIDSKERDGERITGDIQQASLVKKLPLPIKKLELYRINLTQAKFILDSDNSFPSSKWEKVESLELKECQLSIQSFIRILQAMPNLKNLGLYKCKGLDAASIANSNKAILGFYSLKIAVLSMSPQGLNSLELACLTALEKLESLSLIESSLSDNLITWILKNKYNIKKLEIDSCIGLTSSVFSILIGSNLESLKLIKFNISDDVFQDKLKNQVNLRYLDIDLSTGLTESSVLFLERFKIKSLRLSRGDFSNQISPAISKIIKDAEILHLSRCDGLDARVFSFSAPLNNLKIFSLDYCSLPYLSFQIMMRSMINVENVHLKDITFLPNAGTGIAGLNLLKKVNFLILEKSKFSDEFFDEIITAMPNLRQLNLKQCCGFSDIALLNVEKLKKIQILDITGCVFSKKAINSIKKHVQKVIS